MADIPNIPRRASSVDHVNDVIDGVTRYARQETIEPLKGAARWVAVGTAGAVFLGLAVVFLALAVLRLIQDVGGGVLDGSLSFLPYLATSVVLALVVALVFSRISHDSLQRGK